MWSSPLVADISIADEIRAIGIRKTMELTKMSQHTIEKLIRCEAVKRKTRFTVEVAVAQSSFHRFRATLRDVSGITLQSLPIEMNCLVPRSRRKIVENAINPPQANGQSTTTK